MGFKPTTESLGCRWGGRESILLSELEMLILFIFNVYESVYCIHTFSAPKYPVNGALATNLSTLGLVYFNFNCWWPQILSPACARLCTKSSCVSHNADLLQGRGTAALRSYSNHQLMAELGRQKSSVRLWCLRLQGVTDWDAYIPRGIASSKYKLVLTRKGCHSAIATGQISKCTGMISVIIKNIFILCFHISQEVQIHFFCHLRQPGDFHFVVTGRALLLVKRSDLP